METFILCMGAGLDTPDVEGDAYRAPIRRTDGSIDDFGPDGFPITELCWDRDSAVVVFGNWVALLSA